MGKTRYFFTVFFCLFVFMYHTFSQSDAAKIVYNTYFNCFGTIPANAEMNRDMKFINTNDTASLKNLFNRYLENIHDSIALQKDIIAKAFEDSYGSITQNEIDSCFKRQANAVTYQSLTDELKTRLAGNIQTSQLAIIQRSYNDYFGIEINKDDERAKNWMDNAELNKGILYKTLMEEHRLPVIAAPAEQRAIIARAFAAVFGRQIKIAESDSWFYACKYGCSFINLEKKFKAYIQNNPKCPPPVLAPAGTGDAIFVRYGVSLNEACNCTGNKVFLLNTDAVNAYKVVVAHYNLQLNTTTISELTMPPHQEKLLGCTKDVDCIQAITYSILRYEKI